MDTNEEVTEMTDPVHIKNIFEPGTNPMASIMPFLGTGGWGGAGAGAGAGLGAGLLGGVLGGALLGNNGLFGRNGAGEGFVTPTQLQTATNGIIEANQNNAVLQTLGDIKGAIPLAESQVQLALAGVQSDLTQQINTNLLSTTQGIAGINQNVANATATIVATETAVKDAVEQAASANALAIAGVNTQSIQNTFALSQVVTNDGDKTRALIQSINDANLQRQLAVAEAQLAEQRATARSREVEVNVTQSVNQNQIQLQQQQQQQQQLILLSQIATGLANVTQIAHATNSNIIAGNTGAVTTGTQTANPVNVKA